MDDLSLTELLKLRTALNTLIEQKRAHLIYNVGDQVWYVDKRHVYHSAIVLSRDDSVSPPSYEISVHQDRDTRYISTEAQRMRQRSG